MISYCRRCVMPGTRPDLHIDEQGICNACRSFENRKEVDWDQRRSQLLSLLEKYRNVSGSNWDCIVPASGGKDSTYQALKMKRFGMNPLIVTASTCDLSEIGRANIENLKLQGFDCVELSANPLVRRKLNRIGLTQVGDISWPEHVAIFTSPVRLAVQLKIPLLIWGENSQNEYGGPAAAADNHVLNRRWLEEFGGMLGLRVSDMIGMEGIQAKDLIPYTYPSDEALKEVGVTGLFLGYFIPWDGYTNVLYSQAFGLKTCESVIEGSSVNYENMDNHQMGIHDYFKYLKFGFGRASDLVSVHIRRGRLSREEGMEMVAQLDGKFPWTYLGKPIEKILEPLEISIEEFIKICDRFTNKKLFALDSKGNLLKDKKGNLKKINGDNE